MASLPLFLSSSLASSLTSALSSSLVSHFLPKDGGSSSASSFASSFASRPLPVANRSPVRTDSAARAGGSVGPSVDTASDVRSGPTVVPRTFVPAFRISSGTEPARDLFDEPLPRSLFDPFRAARRTVREVRPVCDVPVAQSGRSLFDPLPAPSRRSLTSQPSGDAGSAKAAPHIPHPASTPLPSPPPIAPVARTEAVLREAGLGGQVWRGDALSAAALPSTPSGFRQLDAELPGGGWPARCLTELLLSRTGVGEIRFLAATLAQLTRAGRQIVLLAPPHVPDPTGWEQLGIDMRRVLVVRTEKPADRLWSIEQSLKSSAFGALIAWLPEEKTLARHDALRRLQSVAAASNGLAFLMRPAAAQYHASPAPLRLTLAAGPADDARRMLSVRLLKRRGPVLAQPLVLRLPEVHAGLRLFGLSAKTGEMTAADRPMREDRPVRGDGAPIREFTRPSGSMVPVTTTLATPAFAEEAASG